MDRLLDLPLASGVRKPPPVPTSAGGMAPGPTERRAAAAIGVATLDLLSAGIVCLDGRGRVRHLNLAARRTVAAGDGCAVVRDRLVFDGRAGEALRLLLDGRAGGAFRVVRRSGNSAYAVVVRPMLDASRDPLAFLVFIIDPADAPSVSIDVLCQLWSLTPTEARVAAALAEGLTPAEIATRHRVCEATVRSQMRVIFEKTGTRRQAALVRLVLSCGAF